MDSKLKGIVITLVTLSCISVVAIVIAANYRKIFKKSNNVLNSSETEVVSVSKDELMLGDNLSAFKNDPSFFDSEADTLAAKIMEEMSTLDFAFSSEEKDLRIRILDYEGKVKSGEEFEIELKRGSKVNRYNDDDKDGIIYIDSLVSGEYEITLLPLEEYIVPDKSKKVTVNAEIPFKKISDISLLFSKKSEAEKIPDDCMIIGADAYAAKKQKTSFAKDEGFYGIDISEKNGDIDFEKVYESGIRFVMIRAGYRGAISGDIILDEKFSDYATKASRAGLNVGAYFFTQAINKKEAVEEASALLEVVKDRYITYPLVIRVDQAGGFGRADEISSEQRSEAVSAFLETIKAEGYEPCVYASSNWLKTNLDKSIISKYSVWMAQFESVPTDEIYYDLWQYSSKGNVPGIEGEVSLSQSYR